MKYKSEQEMPDFLKDFARRHKPADLTIEEWAASGREDIRKEEADRRMQRATASIERRLKERRALRPIGTSVPAVATTSQDAKEDDGRMVFPDDLDLER
ncbi:hypothetical protein [Acidithiobacillus ferriphilus]|uniref:hypothetical protein n=1 Tax=Acidithiobacillus ferriphilus TaxID=1689834 RepID=UPI002DBC2BA3|nr:hypothetical protein [Acidithiobacillus ferriphilus]MEB8476240.1 hypothetical protein [Acidithiobacillus ferriphilus]